MKAEIRALRSSVHRSSLSPECSMSSAPSIGTGSPLCSEGSVDVEEQKTHPKDESEIVGLGEGPLPTRHHWGALYSPGGKTGKLRAPNGHCVHSPASGLSPVAR